MLGQRAAAHQLRVQLLQVAVWFGWLLVVVV